MDVAKTQFLITETPYGQKVQAFRRKRALGIFNERGELTTHTKESFASFRAAYPEEAKAWRASTIWQLVPIPNA